MALNGMNKWIGRIFGGIIGVLLLFLGIERKKKETIEEQEEIIAIANDIIFGFHSVTDNKPKR